MAFNTRANEVRILDNINNNPSELFNNNNDLDGLITKKTYLFHNMVGEFNGNTDTVKVSKVYDEFCTDMYKAGNERNSRISRNIIYHALDNVVSGMRMLLDDMEYRKFLQKLNSDMYRNGFIEEASDYCTKKYL